MPTAAHHLIRTLCRLDVDRVFCVPGESYLPVLDALADEPAIDLVTCRHESGAGLMAVADAKMTDRPGVAFVSRGPGATNAALATCVDRWQVPVATSYKHQDLFDNHHPCFAGHLGFGLPPVAWQHLRDADLIVAVGTRLNEITTQRYRLPNAPTPDQPLIHIHPDPAQIGRVFETTVRIVADTIPFLEALGARTPPAPPDLSKRNAWRDRLHTAVLDLARWTPSEAADGVDFGHIVAALNDQLPSDAVLAMDAGNFGGWLHRHFLFRSTHLLLGAVSGAMELGTPAAVAAALRYPARQVVGASSATADS